MRVHQRLKPRRAITLCCTANSPSSARLTSSASTQRRGGTAVDGLGQQRQVADKADRVDEGGEKEDVDDQSVEGSEECHVESPVAQH